MEYKNIEQEIFNATNEKLQALANLFPSVVKDGEVDFEALKEELGQFTEVGKEKYELTWAGKQDAKKISQEDIIGRTLKYVPEDSKNHENTENLYIEGDNLEVLKLLRQNYYNSIKMIYIDPPYNTGNDFVYNDKFAMSCKESDISDGTRDDEGIPLQKNQQSSNRYHANWLNMMYPRLKVAKDLLTDDGVIFISIDDNEVDNLKKICNEIFGEDNHIETIIWKNKFGAGAKTVGFISVHEYILCYSKGTILNITSELGEDERKKYIKQDEKYQTRGGYRTQPVMTKSLGDRPNLMYPIEYNGDLIYPQKQWVWSKERMMNAIMNNDVEIVKREDGTYSVNSKAYLYDELGNIRRGKPVSILNGPFTQQGTKDIKELFEDKSIFDFTKPVELLKYFLSLDINDKIDKDYTVLDFFSGSGTTAQACIQLNAKDNGNRKFIMVQYSEECEENGEAYKAGFKNICEIGKERIRRAGDKIKEENKDKEGIENLDIGFKVFKVSDTNIRWTNEALKSGQIEVDESMLFDKDKLDFMPHFKDIDVVYEVLLRQRDIPLSSKVEKLSHIGKRTYMFANSYVVCLEDIITKEIVETLAAIEPLPIKYVFRDSAFEDDISFKDETFRRLQALIARNTGDKKKAYTVEFI